MKANVFDTVSELYNEMLGIYFTEDIFEDQLIGC